MDRHQKNRRLLGTGITGSVVAAICCFTPFLPFLLGGIGLTAWLSWLDYLFLPLLGFFVALTLLAVALRMQSGDEEEGGP